MSQYHRTFQKGGWYFFTVTTCGRKRLLTHRANARRLRESFARIQAKRPFEIDAIVILPDHLHCIWRMPPDDDDFSTRWRLIKGYFARAIPAEITARQEKKVWQRRFWEHLIRDEQDWQKHMDYIHYNPVKHGHSQSPLEWPHGSFQDAVKKGFYPADWGKQEPRSIEGMDCE